MIPTDDLVIADTQRWLERAVIGLNLCPFAKAVHVKGQIHYAVSHAENQSDLLQDLEREAQELVAIDPTIRDTTLLISPSCLQDFLDYNDFIGRAEKLLRRLKLEGVLQIATFHPQYRFADAAEDDITNYTNRSPYPVLHLLREESIDKAVEAFPEAEEIFERNMDAMSELGHEGWAALQVDATPASEKESK